MATLPIPKTLMRSEAWNDGAAMGEPDQEAQQDNACAHQPGENHSKIAAMSPRGPNNESVDQKTGAVEKKEYDHSQGQQRQPGQESIGHVIEGVPEVPDVSIHKYEM